MANQPSKKADETSRDLSKILDRVDRPPVLDNRSTAEIVGYDENGVPASATPHYVGRPGSTSDGFGRTDMEDWRLEKGFWRQHSNCRQRIPRVSSPRVGVGDGSRPESTPRSTGRASAETVTVAGATELKADRFWIFDERQAKLAKLRD